MSTQAPQQTAFELSVPAIAENVALVRHTVGGLGDALEINDRLLNDIKLAVTEACTNVVVHAYPDGDGQMDVVAAVDGDLLTIVIADSGHGMTPRLDSPGLGLGLPMIATLASSMEIDTESDSRTEVRIVFDLNAPNVGAR